MKQTPLSVAPTSSRPNAAVGGGGADDLPRAAAACRARGHAEQGAGLFVDAGFGAEAGVGHRVGHPRALGQRRAQLAGAHALGVGAGGQPGVVAEHPQEVEARVAGAGRQRVERGDVVRRLDGGAGVAHHGLGDGGALALRVAALAGAEAGGLGLGRVAEEADVLAQRAGRGAAGAAIHAHGGDGVQEIARLAGEDLLPEMLVRQPVDGVGVFHGGQCGVGWGGVPSGRCGHCPGRFRRPGLSGVSSITGTIIRGRAVQCAIQAAPRLPKPASL